MEITTEVTTERNRKKKYAIVKQRYKQLRKLKEFEILFYTFTIKIHKTCLSQK